ncbi:hypothetical protein CRG98_000983 [Punica granatum]|uniref:Uncharacterized protein n=1 Tax=Punica granatum TaxID=22663 RepID=A0A2I0LEF3_PUNGR|nr:hypothetical protein CRG98_000983 [Punica granatum]
MPSVQDARGIDVTSNLDVTREKLRNLEINQKVAALYRGGLKCHWGFRNWGVAASLTITTMDELSARYIGGSSLLFVPYVWHTNFPSISG